ncbi:hypothetical protein Mapa_018702 [Marchantia paleacea]|nr:hypothetical protein Mapa_018702 [Marchantia paleacea]
MVTLYIIRTRIECFSGCPLVFIPSCGFSMMQLCQVMNITFPLLSVVFMVCIKGYTPTY